MNRNYQELLRGELDRAKAAVDVAPLDLEDGVPAAPKTVQDATATVQTAVQDTVTTPQTAVQDSISSAQTAVPDRPSRETMFSTGSPAQARELRWQPSVDDLPSLQPRTSAAEQFRRLRSRMLEYRSSRPLKTVLVSSALPQEGKSFVAANLAVGLNQHRGTRVLLIDGDMRRYSIQKYFGCPVQPGLADFLAGTANPEEVMQRPDAATLAAFPGLAHLTLIPGGGLVEHVADLSEDARFGKLIEYARPLFDWIVVDSSPVTLVSDAVNLARHCDGVLLVVRSGMTDYHDAQRAQNELQASTLLGVVLNAVEGKITPAYYGYGQVENDA